VVGARRVVVVVARWWRWLPREDRLPFAGHAHAFPRSLRACHSLPRSSLPPSPSVLQAPNARVAIFESDQQIGGRVRSHDMAKVDPRLGTEAVASIGGTMVMLDNRSLLGLAQEHDFLPFQPNLQLNFSSVHLENLATAPFLLLRVRHVQECLADSHCMPLALPRSASLSRSPSSLAWRAAVAPGPRDQHQDPQAGRGAQLAATEAPHAPRQGAARRVAQGEQQGVRQGGRRPLPRRRAGLDVPARELPLGPQPAVDLLCC